MSRLVFQSQQATDLIIAGEFKDKMPQCIAQILDLSYPPIEPLAYTKREFQAIKQRTLPERFQLRLVNHGDILLQHGIDRRIFMLPVFFTVLNLSVNGMNNKARTDTL